MRFDHSMSLYLSGAVLIMLLVIGYSLSERKLLWNDELYSQNTAIDAEPYAGLLSLNFPDGNKNPLFYVVQKAVCGIFSYHMPAIYSKELNRTRDIPSQAILRIPSNVYMSLALASSRVFIPSSPRCMLYVLHWFLPWCGCIGSRPGLILCGSY